MKRTFVILLVGMLLVYGRQTYTIFTADATPIRHLAGCLSDIAEEVVAIPLESPPGDSIDQARQIRREGRELFLINRGVLYRFGSDGRFLSRITDPADIRVAGYVVNPVGRQLIVLGNTDDIFYYSFDGRLLEKKKLKSELPGHRMLTAAYHKGHIWSVEEKPAASSAGRATPSTTPSAAPLEEVKSAGAPSNKFAREVVEYDTAFRRLHTHPLVEADLGREGRIAACFAPRLSVAEDTGALYAYEPMSTSEHLLRDTLYLKEKRENARGTGLSDTGVIPLYPLCLGSRMWISSYTNAADPKQNYLFCYDTRKQIYWEVAGGLRDNFYHTGVVGQLDRVGLDAEVYSYCCSGEALRDSFPAVAAAKGSVVFFVTLKS